MNGPEPDGKEYLGRGWAFPVRWTQGRVDLVASENDIRQAIGLLLRTGSDERIMHPDFGAGIDDYVFAPRNAETQFRIQEEVRRALVRWEPRITVEKIEAEIRDEDEARVDVHVDYRIDPHRRPQSLVFPFYLQSGGV